MSKHKESIKYITGALIGPLALTTLVPFLAIYTSDALHTLLPQIETHQSGNQYFAIFGTIFCLIPIHLSFYLLNNKRNQGLFINVNSIIALSGALMASFFANLCFYGCSNKPTIESISFLIWILVIINWIFLWRKHKNT